MNRLLIDKAQNKDNYVINFDKDENVLIEKTLCKKYVFNVNNSSVNMLIITSDKKDVSFEINISGGSVSFNYVNLDSKNVSLCCNLNSRNSSILINNTVVSDSRLANYDIRINHNSKDTASNVYNNGESNNTGSICFNVESYVPKGSTGSKVNQDSKILSLNKSNDNMINPVLLIDEFDSEARHAAFIGDFNENKLFYLMSRGLSKKEARSLLLDGMLIGTLDICFDEKEKLKKIINNRR